MADFLQTYGTWIVGGAFFLLMLRMHAGGHGGHGQRTADTPAKQPGTDGHTDQADGTKRPTRHSGG